MNNIITRSNFGTLSEIIKEVKNRANTNEYGSATEHLFIIGTEVFDRFCKENGVNPNASWWGCKENQLKNSSTIARVVIAHHIEYSYNSRCDKEYWGTASKFLCVLIDGEILRASFYKSTAAEFTFLGDNRDYHDKLPYKWEEDNPSPNKASLLTDKKVQAWYDWLKTRRELYDGIDSEQKSNIEKFLKRVRSIEGCKTSISDNSGYIVKNNIRYSYTISKGIIYDNLEIYMPYGDDKLDTFLLMIDGKYDKKQ